MLIRVQVLCLVSLLSAVGCADSSRGPGAPSSLGPAASPSAPVPSAATPAVSSTPSVASAEAPDAAAPAAPRTEVPADMLGVPGGKFQMGYEGKVAQRDELPVHTVTLAPFLLDRTEVTNEAYFKCVEAGVCRKQFPGSSEANKFGKDEKFRTPKRPISSISQSDAVAYCNWIGRRLPTEAEWERAARGSDNRLFPWGNEKPTREHAVFASSLTEDVGTHPKGAGPYGHLDLAGNVWEWVADMYDPYAYRRASADRGIPGTCDEIMTTLKELKHANQQGFTGSNPIPDECEHVLRGGAFNYDAFGLRSSNRVHHPGKFRLIMSGFRCAKDWPDGPMDGGIAAPEPAPSSSQAPPPAAPSIVVPPSTAEPAKAHTNKHHGKGHHPKKKK